MSDGAARLGVAFNPAQLQLVTEALAALPYHLVFRLMERLGAWSEQPAAPFALSPGELALVVQALGELPFRRVHVLIGSLRQAMPGIEAGRVVAHE